MRDSEIATQVAPVHRGHAWLIYCSGNFVGLRRHPELAALCEFAAGRGYTYLMIDGDAELLPGVATFDW